MCLRTLIRTSSEQQQLDELLQGSLLGIRRSRRAEIFVLQNCVISSRHIQGIVYYYLYYLKLFTDVTDYPPTVEEAGPLSINCYLQCHFFCKFVISVHVYFFSVKIGRLQAPSQFKH